MSDDTLIVEADDPCLDGHFPGNALVPAVVILDAVIAAVKSRFDEEVVGIARCKFLTPLRPGQRCGIQLSRNGRTQLQFVCVAPAGEIARGRLLLR